MARYRYAGYSPKTRHHGKSLDLNEIMHLVISLQMLFGSRRGGSSIILIILVVGAIFYFVTSSGFMSGNANKALASADKLWDNDERVEAITAYKELLRKPDPVDPSVAWLQDSRPRLYRRIITYEAEYGYNNLQDARDWINDAWKEGHTDLRFDSEEAKRLWDEETSKLKKPTDSLNNRKRAPTGNPKDDLIPDLFER